MSKESEPPAGSQRSLPYGEDTLVLCYHALSERFPAQLSTTPELFERQLERLVHRGYRGVTFSQATASPAGRTVAVTFDDGYRSVLKFGLPVLQALGWPATIFVPTDFIGSDRPMSWPGIDRWLGDEHESELLALGWGDLDTLASQGWEVGSHTCSHPRLTQLEDGLLARELSESKSACELHLKRPCCTLAYPYGDVDARVANAAREAGYSSAAALRPGPRSPMEWPRVGVYFKDNLTRFSLKSAQSVRRLRGERPSD
ncbi:MAG TPA: polysaccharide deacetylase family protein [Solirubrobacteraceae bacterium]|jgi:peptidoglycan/xylan/chitin deacetylase (PgdA/CDA1 family)|nr:polysaccharide deacetylase family protein [Solirubrobacteraceae bacterium]